MLAAVFIAVVALVAILGDYSVLAVLGLGLSIALAIAALLPLRGRKLSRVPTATWGMVCAHFGVAVALFGMASESAFTSEKLAAVSPGGTDIPDRVTSRLSLRPGVLAEDLDCARRLPIETDDRVEQHRFALAAAIDFSLAISTKDF